MKLLIRFKKVIILFILCVIGTLNLSAQPWLKEIDHKEKSEITFYDVQKAFNDYWSDKEYVKGSGYKQFKRWEWFMEPRVYPSGKFQANHLLFEDQKRKSKRNSKASTANWTSLGPNLVPLHITTTKPEGAGRVNCVAFHPDNTDIFWIGSASGGLWKTTDGGNNWTTTTNDLPSLGISDIVVHPENPDTIYVATGDGDADDTYSFGIIKSFDGGNTWLNTGFDLFVEQNIAIRRLLINPVNPDVLIAASSDGIYKTKDSGLNWNKVQSGYFKDLEYCPGDTTIIYASTYDRFGGNASIYRSIDGGESFNLVNSGIQYSNINRIKFGVTEANPNIVYAVCSSVQASGLYGVYKSTDKGETWTLLLSGTELNLLGWQADGSDQNGQAWYDLSIVVSPEDEDIIYVGGVNMWKSTNGGHDWNLIGHWSGSGGANLIHADIHFFKYNPEGILFICNDGGIYKTYNDKNYIDLSNGLQILQTYRLGLSATDEDLIVIGNQDNCIYKYNGNFWNEIQFGDGMECLVDYENPDILYGSTQFGRIYKSTDGGVTMTRITSNNQQGAWITPYIMHPTDHNTLFAGYQSVFKTENGGSTWTSISNNFGDVLRTLVIAPSDDNYLYTGTFTNLYKTENGGTNWTEITDGLPDLAIQYIAVANDDPTHLWVTLGGYTDGQKVYESTDAGVNWDNVSDGLPNIPVNCIVHQKNSPDLIYVGTDLGVYYKDNNMTQWEEFNDGLPNVIVNELEIFYPTNKIRAATFGRGIWESYLHSYETTPPVADIKVAKNQVCTNSELIIEDNSFGRIDTYEWDFGADSNPATATGSGPHNVSWPTNGQKTITLTVTGTGGTDQVIKTDYIEVSSELDISIYPESRDLCLSNSVWLTASGAQEYVWSPATGLNITEGERVMSSPNESTTYTVTGTEDGCSGETTINIEINSSPNDNIEDAVLLDFGVTDGFINYCATIENNEPAPPGNGCNTQTGWCTNEIEHTVWFTFVAPASGRVSIESDGFDNQIAVYDANSVEDLLSGNYTLLAANDDHDAPDYSATIDVINNLETGRTYWLQVDGSAGGAEGEFSIELIDLGSSTFVDDLDKTKDSFKIYPNPNNGIFQFEYHNNSIQMAEIKLFDITGRLLWAKKVISNDGNFYEKIDNIELQQGIYELLVVTNNNTLSKKLVVNY